MPDGVPPLTMFNTDTKVLCKVLAEHPQGMVGSIVHEDQCGFVLGRSTAQLAKIDTCDALGDHQRGGISAGIGEYHQSLQHPGRVIPPTSPSTTGIWS
ncbi:hypothetical protein NDU88_001109 [Pleurodeles waltl]|uniref:Reverse transcriptase domain-containing protein n=1 Tax=Pleurodeles waltl TaxID=8319 RepID=A0AAV7S998_PLEWA|nr:hypothetical protein NDU88_001109 [Pleurodeles waltl]